MDKGAFALGLDVSFFNHNCQNNAATYFEHDTKLSGKNFVYVLSLKHISIGSQVFINYNYKLTHESDLFDSKANKISCSCRKTLKYRRKKWKKDLDTIQKLVTRGLGKYFINKIIFPYWNSVEFFYNSFFFTVLLEQSFLFYHNSESNLDLLYKIKNKTHHSGKQGLAINLCTPPDLTILKDIWTRYKQQIDLNPISSKSLDVVYERFQTLLGYCIVKDS
jgi:hypothetical protein